MHINQKIFNIGLPKTGTSSLCRALELLGIKSLHYPSNFKTLAMQGDYSFRSIPKWQKDWQALCNFGEHIYPQLDKAYPGSKFILTERNIDSWLESIERQIAQSDGNSPDAIIRPKDLIINPKLIRRACQYYNGHHFESRNLHTRIEIFGCYRFNYDRFKQVYELHNRNVREYFNGRPGDLLIIDISESARWHELCEFLDLPIPDGVSFPYIRPEPSR